MRPSAPDRYVYCLVYAMQSSNDAEESMGSRQRCDAALSAEAVVRLDTVTAASRDWFTAHLGTVVAP
jgi:hypothetical protein